MPRRFSTPTRRASRAGSWLALLAATTLGPGAVECVDAVVAGDEAMDDAEGSLRLVVQSFAAASVSEHGVPARGTRPLSSLQRAVTAAELRSGVPVRLIQLGAVHEEPTVVLAWVEHGEPDLELDALTASPGAHAAVGWSPGDDASGIRVVLRKRA